MYSQRATAVPLKDCNRKRTRVPTHDVSLALFTLILPVATVLLLDAPQLLCMFAPVSQYFGFKSSSPP